MIINENYRKVPVRFYEDDYGTVYYESDFTQGTAPSLKDAFFEFSREDFARDFIYYLDDVIDVKVGQFKPALKDKKLKGMKFIGSLDIKAEVGKDFRNSPNSLTYLSKHRNEIPRHEKWVSDMKMHEIFDPIKTSHDLICKHCNSIISEGSYFEEYRGNAYHLECIWDKLINKNDGNFHQYAIDYFLSLRKYIGDWPAYGLDVEDDYLHDLELFKHNIRTNKLKESMNETYKNLSSKEDKEKYAKEVWDILHRSYESIGGLKGSGFKNIQDMIDSFPMWKLNIKDGKVILVALYKDKSGRKFCAGGTDRSLEGRKMFKDFIKAELATGRSWGEISGPLLDMCIKHYPELIDQATIDPKEIEKISDKPITIKSKNTYSRKLGNGEEHEKRAIGRFNQPIKKQS